MHPLEPNLVYLGQIQVKIQQTNLIPPRTLWSKNACRFCCYCEDGHFVIDCTHEESPILALQNSGLKKQIFPYFRGSEEACKSSVSSWREEVGQAVKHLPDSSSHRRPQKKPCASRQSGNSILCGASLCVAHFVEHHDPSVGSLLNPKNVMSHLINASYKFSWTETPILPTTNFIREFC